MADYETNKRYVKDLLDIALKYNNMYYYLVGGPGYDLRLKDREGTKTLPITLIMESIYDKYTSDPQSEVDKKFYSTVAQAFCTIKNGSCLIDLLREVEHQLKAEKEHKAPFTVDCKALLQMLSDNIKKNYDLYSQPVESLNLQKGFVPEFEYHDDILDTNYGHKIM